MSTSIQTIRKAGFSLLLGALLLAGCSRHARDDGKMTFHGAYQDDVKTLDPANAYDVISLDVVPQIYETLYQYSYLSETYRVEPLLAADMPKYSADRLTVTIHLRQDVRFQDDACFKASLGHGRALTAHDFVYAWKRLALPRLQSTGWWIFDGKIAGINAFHDKLVAAPTRIASKEVFDSPVEGIRALDDSTLQIKLTKPYPQLPFVLSMSFTAPVPHEAVEAYADADGNLLDHPVGTGPFLLKKWDRNRLVVLERNPAFREMFYPSEGSAEYRKLGMLADAGKKLPFLDRVEMQIIKEAQPAWLNFLKGELDTAAIPKDNFSQAITQGTNLQPELAAKGIRLSIDTGTTFYYLGMNMKDRLLGSNELLRQAIASAVDRDKWIELFTNGRGKKQVTALPPGIQDRPANPRLKYDLDLARAKSLLAKAGFPEGAGLPPINFDLRGADTISRQMGDFFTQQLARIGIKLNVIANTFPAFLEKMKKANLQLYYGGWVTDYPDAENVFQLLYGPNESPGPNEANFNSKDMNSLYEKMAVLEPGPARAALVSRMDEILQEQVPWALGYYHSTYRLSQPWLLNFRQSEIIQNRFKYYRVDRETKRRYQETRR